MQLLGIAACAVWTFGIAYPVLKLINRAHPLRVSAEHEEVGLNLAEHGEVEDFDTPLQTIDTGQAPTFQEGA